MIPDPVPRYTFRLPTIAALFVFGAVFLTLSAFRNLPDFRGVPTHAPNLKQDDRVLLQALTAADPANGAALFQQYGCANCHGIDNGTAPYVVGLGARAVTRRAPEYSAAAYIYESIVNPNAYVVDGYQTQLMPHNFRQVIAPTELNDLVAWLLTQ